MARRAQAPTLPPGTLEQQQPQPQQEQQNQAQQTGKHTHREEEEKPKSAAAAAAAAAAAGQEVDVGRRADAPYAPPRTLEQAAAAATAAQQDQGRQDCLRPGRGGRREAFKIIRTSIPLYSNT